jgi:DNA-binding beta-propeller fold protein YncE
MIAKLRFARFGGCCLLLALLSGCATKHPAPVTYTFFPPAPDEPRVQFLTSFSAGVDLGGSGSFIDFLTGRPAAPNALIKPYGLAVKDGKIFVCDTVAVAVEVFDLVKKRARYFAPRGEGRFLMPINISIDADGTRYVADTGRGQIVIFDRNENFLGAIGIRGEMKPCDVAIASDRLYVADIKGHAVRVYDKATRKLLFTIPRDPNAKEGKLFSPTNLALDPQGRLLVSDTGGFTVQVYDLDGKYLRMIGQQGLAPGSFSRPKGVAADHNGLAYVVDAATQVVQIFDAEGRLLLYFGQPGASTRGELSLPAVVKVDYDNVGLFQKYVAPGHQCEYLILATSQFGSQKVNVYGLLKKSAAP